MSNASSESLDWDVLCHRMPDPNPAGACSKHSTALDHSLLWSSLLGMSPHKSVAVKSQGVPDCTTSTWAQKAQGSGPHSENLNCTVTVLYEMHLGTPWSMRGPGKPQWFPSSLRYVIHITLKPLIPA